MTAKATSKSEPRRRGPLLWRGHQRKPVATQNPQRLVGLHPLSRRNPGPARARLHRRHHRPALSPALPRRPPCHAQTTRRLDVIGQRRRAETRRARHRGSLGQIGRQPRRRLVRPQKRLARPLRHVHSAPHGTAGPGRSGTQRQKQSHARAVIAPTRPDRGPGPPAALTA